MEARWTGRNQAKFWLQAVNMCEEEMEEEEEEETSLLTLISVEDLTFLITLLL